MHLLKSHGLFKKNKKEQTQREIVPFVTDMQGHVSLFQLCD